MYKSLISKSKLFFLYRSEDPHNDMEPTGTPREDDSYVISESFYYLFIIKIKCFDHIHVSCIPY